MIQREKITEWLKEIEARPSSAGTIVRFLANRLFELTERNEELLAEVIALQSGAKTDDYEKRIKHLEYQIELLKSRLNRAGNEQVEFIRGTSPMDARPKPVNILIYDPQGRVARLEIEKKDLELEKQLGLILSDGSLQNEPPRMLPVTAGEELLFLFSSGRIFSLNVEKIPSDRVISRNQEDFTPLNLEWAGMNIPVSPHAGEKLVCVTPISTLPLAHFFVQFSRKGFGKKIRIEMAESILQNQYIGTGIQKAPDQPFELLLSGTRDRWILVSWEGYLQQVDAGSLPVAVEPVMRLSASDHIVSSCLLDEDASLLILTTPGKIVHVGNEKISSANAPGSKGQPIFSAKRREQGIRVVGAAPFDPDGWGVVLASSGEILVFRLLELADTGTLPAGVEPVSFTALSGNVLNG